MGFKGLGGMNSGKKKDTVSQRNKGEKPHAHGKMVCLHMCVHVCGSQRTVPVVILGNMATSFEMGSLTVLEIPVRLDQLEPPVFSSQHRGSKCSVSRVCVPCLGPLPRFQRWDTAPVLSRQGCGHLSRSPSPDYRMALFKCLHLFVNKTLAST